ncbi:MAG: chromosome segregation protein SMC [Candidatus Acidiferrales bacterium]
MLKLRKVEMLGFKSFCEKTQITFSGNGITCIVGPNGCGKSNIVDAISWVLGEQSHKSLRAERMSDCIFNGTAKRPPLGLSEVMLTLVDEELAQAAAFVLDSPEETPAAEPNEETNSRESAGGEENFAPATGEEESVSDGIAAVPDPMKSGKPWKKRGAEKPAMRLKPGEVVIGRRLYRSGQSEYLINGKVSRLRDIQEVFMGIGLGPDSYAIIEQGRIGQILNSKPTDRRAIIEEAAGVTMYKTKRRLAEAKLEASKVNLARVNDILVEVDKQLGSLKRQASKARRYAELREQMRGLMRTVLASKARELDSEAERLETALREAATAEEFETRTVRELEGEVERISSRTYELDGELRQTQNYLGQAALELDRAENRVLFNREQVAQLGSRSEKLSCEIAQAEAQTSQMDERAVGHRTSVAALREETGRRDAALKEMLSRAAAGTEEQGSLESRIEELRRLAIRLGEDAVRWHADSLQAEEAFERHSQSLAQRERSLQQVENNCAELDRRSRESEATWQQLSMRAREMEQAVRSAQARIEELRQGQQEAGRRVETTREESAATRARKTSVEQILNERAYSAEAVQKLFTADRDGSGRGFRAVGVLADYVEVEEQYESALEQFLHEELEYVVVETFEHARAGVSLLRDEMGGRATFFVDSVRNLQWLPNEMPAPILADPGVISRLDRLVNFRDPLGAAAKQYLPALRAAYLVEDGTVAEKLAHENPQMHFVTLDGTCYQGRMVSGGRPGDAGPLALKRELRSLEAEVIRLENAAAWAQADLNRIQQELRESESGLGPMLSQHVEAEKALVAATHQREQTLAELGRFQQQLAECQQEISRLRGEATAAHERAELARVKQGEAVQQRAGAEAEAAQAGERLIASRQELVEQRELLTVRREELATMSERLASAELLAARLEEELRQARERSEMLREQAITLTRERAELEANILEVEAQVESFRSEKAGLEARKIQLEKEWEEARTRNVTLDDTLRVKRQSLDDVRSARTQREIEKARNDSDRDHLRQTCQAEVNCHPEELIAQEQQLLSGEELIAADASYSEMKARIESMGPVNMMALEEYQECEQRSEFLTRERDDLVESIQNTQLAIAELDQISRQKFEEAYNVINRNFAVAFQALFGGGSGEMRLTEPDSSGDAGIDVVAQPPGKRLQNVLLLSGGEKAMTALALLIAIFHFRPSPFCILDEVDAPLDESNVGRFTKMLGSMSEQTQFIIVTHNRRTMEMGSVLYGVTMQEPGVSKLVSVRWEEAQQMAEAKTNAA